MNTRNGAVRQANQQTETRSKKVRGMARKSLDLIEEMHTIARECRPINGRGVGYKLFTAGLISSMSRSEMQRVYRLLTEARERGIIPWQWIVDETRELEQVPSWNDPAAFVRAAISQYRRDYWHQQPVRVEVWSEKGTVRGVLDPVLDQYGVGFRVMHGFGSATTVYDVAKHDDGRPLVALYVGDWDPSGIWMSERDLPERISRYGGDHVRLVRVALLDDDLRGLPSFAAADKRKDPRFNWFSQKFGDRCWELDAMDPNELRIRIEGEITAQIEPDAWRRCEITERAEHESLRTVLSGWRGA